VEGSYRKQGVTEVADEGGRCFVEWDSERGFGGPGLDGSVDERFVVAEEFFTEAWGDGAWVNCCHLWVEFYE